jgi:hypothetical protein
VLLVVGFHKAETSLGTVLRNLTRDGTNYDLGKQQLEVRPSGTLTRLLCGLVLPGLATRYQLLAYHRPCFQERYGSVLSLHSAISMSDMCL